MQNTCGRLLLPQVEEESKRVRRNFYLIHLIIFLPEMFKYLSAAFQDLIDNNLWIYIQKQNCAFHFWLLKTLHGSALLQVTLFKRRLIFLYVQ